MKNVIQISNKRKQAQVDLIKHRKKKIDEAKSQRSWRDAAFTSLCVIAAAGSQG